MIRWPGRTSPEEDARERQIAGEGPQAVYKPYEEVRLYLDAVDGFRTHLWLMALLMGVAVLGATGLGRWHRAGEWAWVTMVSFSAAGLCFLVAAPRQTLAPAGDEGSSRWSSLRLGWTSTRLTLLALAYFVLPVAMEWELLRPVLPDLIIGFVGLVIAGFGDLMRRINTGLILLFSPFCFAFFLWPSPLADRFSGQQVVATSLVVFLGLGIFLLRQIPEGAHPVLTVARVATAGLLLFPWVVGRAEAQAAIPHLSPWLLPCWIAVLLILERLETASARGHIFLVPLAPAAIHLVGLLAVPSVDPGPIRVHWTLVSLEFVLVLLLCHQRWMAYLKTEYVPINYRPTPVYVPRFDHGQDYPLESRIDG